MGVDRRALLVGMGLVFTAACAKARQPRGSSVTNGDWARFKAAFLDPSGRIVDNGNGGVSHSEGQGYGLGLALWNDDREAFDAILRWTDSNLVRPDMALYAWRYDPRQPNPVADTNNATDGDLFIAWALAEAAKSWGEGRYASRSAEIRAAIRQHLVLERHGRKLLLPGLQGFVTPEAVTLNPSYFVWPALDAFRRLDGEAAWGRIISDSEALMAAAQFGPLKLPTDWVDVTGHDMVLPAVGKPARFGFDAIRVPLYAQAGRRAALLKPIRDYWQGYVTRQQPIPAWVDVQSGEVAPYALSAGGMAIAGKIMGLPQPAGLSTDYYAASLQMLAGKLA
ncbi:glycosyl hydrolase family 8 [Sphingobium yanoikuyae]|uniref:glycosyl hydrolase family 8 n=1 Tax=Sphingobium yanoikuyae TaxID=13690 RepID=UPI0022DE91AF|nr:glycosyl hydrolase family 8 [Sphingobium yanoikuyae]WBQ18409.1 glycosyl hydrolase family 8 [Sphingobium yanoikuyae]